MFLFSWLKNHLQLFFLIKVSRLSNLVSICFSVLNHKIIKKRKRKEKERKNSSSYSMTKRQFNKIHHFFIDHQKLNHFILQTFGIRQLKNRPYNLWLKIWTDKPKFTFSNGLNLWGILFILVIFRRLKLSSLLIRE